MILDLYNLQESGETIKSRLAKENVSKINYIDTRLKILQDQINGWKTVEEINYTEINDNPLSTKNQLYIKIGYLNDNKSEEHQKAKDEAKQKDREELAAIIGNAVSAALTAWSESHKELTVQFSDSPEKIFGEIRNG